MWITSDPRSFCLPFYGPLLLVVITAICCPSVSAALRNPYEILEVKQNAPITEIKHKYKTLVRQWHPDKNSESEAEAKFIEINKAYELLSDPERREEFDKFGVTEDTPNFRSRPDYSSFKRFDYDPFESMFASAFSGEYRFNSDNGNLFRKQSITTKAYENRVVPESFTRPYLILFYGDLCLPCLSAEAIWGRLVHELEPLGVGFATIHATKEPALTKKLGVSTLPTIIGLADGIVKKFSESTLNLIKVIEFLRRLLPRNLIQTVDDTNYVEFLDQWRLDNRVRVVFANHDKVIRLRYLLLAFRFKERFASAHLTIDTFDGLPSAAFVSRYNIDSSSNSMLIFNEDISRPAATLTADDLKTNVMAEVLEANKFLSLPRLSSQSLFNQLCPVDGHLKSSPRRLCIILITNNIPGHDLQREAMRTFIRTRNYSSDRFRFMYLYAEKQPEFISGLIQPDPAEVTSSSQPPLITTQNDAILKVLILWRIEVNRIMYQWLPTAWDPRDQDNFNDTQATLVSYLESFNKNVANLDLPNRVKIADLVDESASGIIGKMIKKIMIMTDGVTDHMSQKEVLPFLSVALSLVFILLIGYILQYLVKMEQESISERYRRLGRQPPGVPKPKPEPKLHIHELRSETYNGLIRLLKPGCRTIVLLVDAESKNKLLSKFYKNVFPYRKNKTLMFAYLMIEKNLEWYKKILQQTLGENRELNINPKNCIGTVIALNGFRKYFCVFHAKHPESATSSSTTAGYNRRRQRDKSNFLGFEEELEPSDGDEDLEAGTALTSNHRYRQEQIDLNQLTPEEAQLSSIVFEQHLLDGLSNWLDRLFDGTTQKYHIQYWPDHMK